MFVWVIFIMQELELNTNSYDANKAIKRCWNSEI